MAEQCDREPTCSFCCEAHELKDCTYRKIEESYCLSCQVYGHPSSSSLCPEWKKECAIQKIKKLEKKTYSEAAQEYDKRNKKEDPEATKTEDRTEKEDTKKIEDKKQEDVVSQDKLEQDRRPQVKRKTDESTEDTPEATPLDQSGVEPDPLGGWQTATSRRKKR